MTDTRQVMSDLVERLGGAASGLDYIAMLIENGSIDQGSERQSSAVEQAAENVRDAIARITELENTLATVQRAAKTIMIHEADELRQLRDERVKWHQAIATLDSERQANALLTDRVDALETSLAEARRQALEEAAKVVDRWEKFKWNGIDIDDARDVSGQMARAIRDMKDRT